MHTYVHSTCMHTYDICTHCIWYQYDMLYELVMFVGHFLLSCSAKQSLKVREHQTLGPYVEGLLKLAVTSFSVSGSGSQSNLKVT